MSITWFILQNTLLAILALYIAKLLFGTKCPYRFLTALLILPPNLVVACSLTLGTFKWLRPESVSVWLGMALLGVVFLKRRQDRIRPADWIGISHSIRSSWKHWTLVLVLSVIIGIVSGRFVLGRMVLGPDGLSYHSVFAALRVVYGDLAIHVPSYTAHYPYNAELLSTWWMLPFHNDAFVCFTGYFWSIAFLLIVTCIGQRLGLGPIPAGIGLACIILSPEIQHSAHSFAAVDLAAAATLLAAIFFTDGMDESAESKVPSADAMMCGLAAGYSIGCKVTMLIPCIILFLSIPFSGCRKIPAKKRLAGLGIAIGCAILSGGFWYVRNLVMTGNPFFPAEFGPFEGPFLRELQTATKLLPRILESFPDSNLWKQMITIGTDWPFNLFVLSIAGYALGIFRLLSHPFPWRRQAGFSEFLLLCMGIFGIITYPLLPFSASSNPGLPLQIQMRYLLAYYCMGIMLLAVSLTRKSGMNPFWFTLVILLIVFRYGFRPGKIVSGAVITAGCVGVVYWIFSGAWLRWAHSSVVSIGIGLAGLCGGLSYWADYHAGLNAQTVYGYEWGLMSQTWEKLESFPAGSRIAFLGVHPAYAYPYFGRNLQHRPVWITPEGLPEECLYLKWNRDPASVKFWHQDVSWTDPITLVRNLRSSAVDYLILSRWRYDVWPVQGEWGDKLDYVSIVYRDSTNCIWRISNPEIAESYESH